MYTGVFHHYSGNTKALGCMDVIKILDEMDAWSNPLFVYVVSDYLFDLAKRDS